jgi:hypothetical protein
MRVLTDALINLLRGLPARADARCMISAMPLGGIFWEDEMPESAVRWKLSEDERMTLWRLFGIRYKIWDDEPLSPDDQSLWDSARVSAPTWALFHRLTLTDADRESREQARAEVESTWEALFGDADEIEVTEKEPGFIKVTAKGVNKKRHKPRIQ